MATALHPHERVALRKQRLLWILAGLVLLCVFGALGGFWFWSHRQSQRVAKILVAASARGEPVSGSELNVYFRTPGDEEDATAHWTAGIQPLIAAGYHQEATGIPLVGDDAAAANIADAILPTRFKQSQEHLKKHHDSLEKFYAAAAIGGRARFPVDFRAGVGTLLPFTQGARDAARLLQLDIRVKAIEGDARGCAKSLMTLLLLSRCLEREPCAVSQNVCGAIEVLGDESLARLLGTIDFTPDELDRFGKVIASRDANPRLREGLIGERVMGISAFEDPAAIVEGPSRYFITNADLALYLEHIEKMLAATERDFPDCLVEVQKAQDSLDAKCSEGVAVLTSGLTRSLTPDFKKNIFMTAAAATAKNRAALAALAVDRYRRANQNPPRSLADLIPAYFAAEPLDPYTGKPMSYRLTPTGYAIYGLGENAVDHQGTDLSGDDPGLWIPLPKAK